MIASVVLDPPLVATLALTGAAAGGLGLVLAVLGLERVRRLGRRLDADVARTYTGGRVFDGRPNGAARLDGIGWPGRVGRGAGSRRWGGHGGSALPDFGAEGAAGRAAGSVDLRTELADLVGAPLPETRADAIRNVAVVRYDAFPGIGGQMSFSAALLDDAGDGLVLTVINGRNEARTYAKDIRDGTSIHRLSEDEVGAIDQALGRTRAP